MATTQSSLETFRAGTDTEEIVRTVKLKLHGADWKRDRVRRAIDDWQDVARHAATVLPSFPSYTWGNRSTQLCRVVRQEFDDTVLYAHDRDQAAATAREAFASWHELGQPGEKPIGEFGDANYMVMSSSSSSKHRRSVERNDNGLGFQLSIVNGSRNPSKVWFDVSAGEYQREWLEPVLDGDGKLGACELRIDDTGQLWAHVTVSTDVEVYQPGDVETTVGVDFGERVLWAVAVVGPDGVEDVEMETGREFRHHREQLAQRRRELSEAGDLAGVKATKGDRQRYTEQVTHSATRRIVDLAAEHAPCKIRFEDLSEYRETATDPIHDWPHGMLTEQLTYKATEAGLPAEAINPAETSITCRKCGDVSPGHRDEDEFHCRNCGYEVHADVNAAINIATGI